MPMSAGQSYAVKRPAKDIVAVSLTLCIVSNFDQSGLRAPVQYLRSVCVTVPRESSLPPRARGGGTMSESVSSQETVFQFPWGRDVERDLRQQTQHDALTAE